MYMITTRNGRGVFAVIPCHKELQLG